MRGFLGWLYGQELSETDPLYRSATGITLVSVIFVQVANLVGRRHETKSGLDAGLLRNSLLWAGVALELVFAYAVLYCASVSNLLGTAPVPPQFVVLAALGAPLFLGLDSLRKRLAGAGTRAH